jgi:hypothetical protein
MSRRKNTEQAPGPLSKENDMYPLKVSRIVGGLLAIALAVLSSTFAEARSDHQFYGHRIAYREYNNPDAYPIGSGSWWQEMDRQGRGGRK